MNIYWIFYWKPLWGGDWGYDNALVEADDVESLLYWYEDVMGYEITKIYLWRRS